MTDKEVLEAMAQMLVPLKEDIRGLKILLEHGIPTQIKLLA